MANKLNLINLENAVNRQTETKTVHIDIFGEEFDVKVQQTLTVSNTEKVVENIVTYLEAFNEDVITPDMMFTMALLRSLTDIDFSGQTPEGDLVLLSYLVESGKLAEIINAIPLEVMKKLTAQIQEAASFLMKEAEKNGSKSET